MSFDNIHNGTCLPNGLSRNHLYFMDLQVGTTQPCAELVSTVLITGIRNRKGHLAVMGHSNFCRRWRRPGLERSPQSLFGGTNFLSYMHNCVHGFGKFIRKPQAEALVALEACMSQLACVNTTVPRVPWPKCLNAVAHGILKISASCCEVTTLPSCLAATALDSLSHTPTCTTDTP